MSERTAQAKAALRAQIRARYPGDAARDAESRALCRAILASGLYRDAAVVAGYMPLRREADIRPVLEDVLASGRTLALPLCSGGGMMTLRRVESLAQLQPGMYGIPEPREEWEIIPADQVDLLLIPLEGVDQDGMRLGKGGGYYDRLLKAAGAAAMGCALSWQWTDHVPAEPWDMPLQYCADRDGVWQLPRRTDQDAT